MIHRFVTLTILLSGALAAQTQNWSQPNLQQYFKQYKFPPQTVPKSAPPTVAVKTCAVPLVNVMKKDTTNDRMVAHVGPSNPAVIVSVPPPAPSCDDLR
jgi:hypothetical protein